MIQSPSIAAALASAREKLLAARVASGHWEGHLSPSALSTATASCALEIVRRNRGADRSDLVKKGLAWLVAHQNPDGGFGDTPESPSNISTSVLCWATLGLGSEPATVARAEAWIKRETGDLSAPALAKAIARQYGEDRTFSVPILTMCALAGRLGEGRAAWRHIPPLPFELATLPRAWFGWLGLRVVSYALPALIAIGQAIHLHRGSWNPFRALARKRTLRLLEAIQPSSGGFLEATPLTSFVTMSLAGSGQVANPVTRKGADFLAASARDDGSWAIDSNLATWVTTLSVQALGDALPQADRRAIREWLLKQQYRQIHPYTGAEPGGWAWTDLPGGVPDADDTSGALLALSSLREGDDPEVCRAARDGVRWLLGLQNRDGGIPTFCRGWGKLPFDQSCPDLTAHALRAWAAWPEEVPRKAIDRAIGYLVNAQRADGSWVPLWFGNQHAKGLENPVYGTSRVLLCASVDPANEAWKRGRTWLFAAQNGDGSFGSSIEETALALEALGPCEASSRGATWLAERTAEGTRFQPSPIGLYFAKLWYWERLYPVIFTTAALRSASGIKNQESRDGHSEPRGASGPGMANP